MFIVSAQNFGPIIEGRVILRPLTVFLGPGSTGKSYMAMLVYGMLRTLGQLSSEDEPTTALDAELTRLFGPVRTLVRYGNPANTLRIRLEQTGPTWRSLYWELPPESSGLLPYSASTNSGLIADGLPSACYYLPAARSWIAQSDGQYPAEGIGADFARHWRAAAYGKRPLAPATEAVGRVGKYLEDNILHGVIETASGKGVTLAALPSTPLLRASATTTELAPLLLLLKRALAPGDLLIIEEPESHLHPMAQLHLARGIVRLVNAGVQTLVTTNSSDFIDQINNLISLSNVSRETAERLGLQPEECLCPEQVSAYGFRMSPDRVGSETYPLTVTADVGVEDEEFLEITESLYKQAIELQRNRLS